jgi:hypothetical protein
MYEMISSNSSTSGKVQIFGGSPAEWWAIVAIIQANAAPA